MDSYKEMAIEFLRLAAAGEVDQAYGKYVAANFRHHNPWFRGDAAALSAGMGGFLFAGRGASRSRAGVSRWRCGRGGSRQEFRV